MEENMWKQQRWRDMVEKITDRKVMSSLEQNVAFMNQMLPVSESFDIIRRDIEIGGKKSSFYFIDGFTKDDTMQKLMTSLMGINRYDMPEDATTFSQRYIPYVKWIFLVILTRFCEMYCLGYPAFS